jgi:radical SAM protein with 4Fe4S-binding SPASM domain
MKCAWLENMMSIETDGWTRPCCAEPSKEARIAHINNGIQAAWNNSKLLELREDLKNGYSKKTRPFCNRCEILESADQPSMRTSTPFATQDRTLKTIQFKMSNKCQLTCAHCGPELSTGWKKFLKITPIASDSFELTDEFLKELGELLPQITCLKFTGGEPFLDPNHWKILDYLKQFNRSHCALQYITNGISPFKPELWKGWKAINCSVSVDGFEESYEWFRRGSSWNELLEGVDRLKKFSNVSINFAMTPYTIQDYHISKNFWGTLGTYLVVHPKHASLLDFPADSIKQLDRYQSIPYADAAKGTNLNFYKSWARMWDTKWNTIGWAEKLFPWMKE